MKRRWSGGQVEIRSNTEYFTYPISPLKLIPACQELGVRWCGSVGTGILRINHPNEAAVSSPTSLILRIIIIICLGSVRLLLLWSPSKDHWVMGSRSPMSRNVWNIIWSTSNHVTLSAPPNL